MSDSYIINGYGRKPVFSSFLPGVAGEKGIPLWCFYVNRGQCIAGFGSRDKNHSIMEFSPANTAYQRVQFNGFRTFLKIDGIYVEPFADGLGDMCISENSLRIVWESALHQIRLDVKYFMIPNQKIGMLARRIQLINLSKRTRNFELLDGLSAIVPFGLSQHDLKMMGQTAKAWMMVEGAEQNLPYFRLRASLVDTTSVQAIEDGSFGCACSEGRLLPVIVDPALIFGWDTSFASPSEFSTTPLADLLRRPQRKENELPCCFFAWHGSLNPDQVIHVDSLFGISHGREAFHPVVDSLLLRHGIDKGESDAETLLDPYVQAIETHSADSRFDRYCRQSYIDNFLRGGIPRLFRGKDQSKLFYLFSRKHGDLERDYNDFVVTPEYASQGNGNFRDVLQNRRSDPRFCPEAGWQPLKPFLELIQSDGYNPLVIQPVSYEMKNPSIITKDPLPKTIQDLLSHPFTPGQLFMALETTQWKPGEQETFANEVLAHASAQVNAVFGEGYWIDHWVYLLDLLESYLSIFPENKKELLEERCLRWYESRAVVNPLRKRCVLVNHELRQHHALDENVKKNTTKGWLCTVDRKEVISTAMEKLFMLCVLKFAAYDPFGEGISMEAGKPGWYDALNGLPGLFGSSTPESAELWRLLLFLKEAVKGASPLRLPAEMANLARMISRISSLASARQRWEQATSVLEQYREATAFYVCSQTEVISSEEAAAILSALEKRVSSSVIFLIQKWSGAIPTYFTNLPSDWVHTEAGIQPTEFTHHALPLFLEGPMHLLRLPLNAEVKKTIVNAVRSSELYDSKLKMYKVCTDLTQETPEIGRANAFTRGWLEHESIWLHMEYKYLLELLKNEFYEEFFRDFEHALIPFQPPERYGRSILENSSFLASSANPDPATHGRGFVARLSGATAEFLEMWQIMFFGVHPFSWENDRLSLKLSPTIPKALIRPDGCIAAMFLGHTPVTYHFPTVEDITPSTHKPSSYVLTSPAGEEAIPAEKMDCLISERIRNGYYSSIYVEMIHR